jgi:cation transport ATPase
MSSGKRRLWIWTFWACSLVSVACFLLGWGFPRRPSSEPADDVIRWVGLLLFGGPWLLDLVVALPIALSLDSRWGPQRRWILGIWTLLVMGTVGLVLFIFPASDYKTLGLLALAFPGLFTLLLILLIALWLEKKAAERSSVA